MASLKSIVRDNIYTLRNTEYFVIFYKPNGSRSWEADTFTPEWGSEENGYFFGNEYFDLMHINHSDHRAVILYSQHPMIDPTVDFKSIDRVVNLIEMAHETQFLHTLTAFRDVYAIPPWHESRYV